MLQNGGRDKKIQYTYDNHPSFCYVIKLQSLSQTLFKPVAEVELRFDCTALEAMVSWTQVSQFTL